MPAQGLRSCQPGELLAGRGLCSSWRSLNCPRGSLLSQAAGQGTYQNSPELSRTTEKTSGVPGTAASTSAFPSTPPTGQTVADPESAGEGKECEPNTRGAPGGLPRGGLWPTRRTWGPQRGPPKRCPILKFKCARDAASACEHADPGTDIGRLSVGRPISEGTQREVCV